MILISHRGNINGKKPDQENNPEYVLKALEQGYHVEVDVWWNNGYWLGHDEPTYEIDISFLQRESIWCHAKNLNAFARLIKNFNVRCFWHQEDDYTLTSCGHIWTFPKKLLYYDSVCVMPELGYQGDISQCYAICSDYIEEYKKYER